MASRSPPVTILSFSQFFLAASKPCRPPFGGRGEAPRHFGQLRPPLMLARPVSIGTDSPDNRSSIPLEGGIERVRAVLGLLLRGVGRLSSGARLPKAARLFRRKRGAVEFYERRGTRRVRQLPRLREVHRAPSTRIDAQAALSPLYEQDRHSDGRRLVREQPGNFPADSTRCAVDRGRSLAPSLQPLEFRARDREIRSSSPELRIS
jgi:hypothetical protein